MCESEAGGFEGVGQVGFEFHNVLGFSARERNKGAESTIACRSVTSTTKRARFDLTMSHLL